MRRASAHWASDCRDKRVKPLFNFTMSPGVPRPQVLPPVRHSTLAQDVADDQMGGGSASGTHRPSLACPRWGLWRARVLATTSSA
eukprot:5457663-Pyramimonas_sp.AAC.1